MLCWQRQCSLHTPCVFISLICCSYSSTKCFTCSDMPYVPALASLHFTIWCLIFPKWEASLVRSSKSNAREAASPRLYISRLSSPLSMAAFPGASDAITTVPHDNASSTTVLKFPTSLESTSTSESLKRFATSELLTGPISSTCFSKPHSAILFPSDGGSSVGDVHLVRLSAAARLPHLPLDTV